MGFFKETCLRAHLVRAERANVIMMQVTILAFGAALFFAGWVILIKWYE